MPSSGGADGACKPPGSALWAATREAPEGPPKILRGRLLDFLASHWNLSGCTVTADGRSRSHHTDKHATYKRPMRTWWMTYSGSVAVEAECENGCDLVLHVPILAKWSDKHMSAIREVRQIM